MTELYRTHGKEHDSHTNHHGRRKPVVKPAGNRHGHHHGNRPGYESDTGLHCRHALQLLHEDRQQEHASHQHGELNATDRRARQEGFVAKQPQINSRSGGRQFANDERRQGDQRHGARHADLGRLEPVLGLPFLQKILQARHANAHQRDPDPVEVAALSLGSRPVGAGDVLRLVYEP